MGKLRLIWERSKETEIKITTERERREQNQRDLIELNYLLTTNKKVSKFTTDLEHLNELVISDDEQYFYKQFEVIVFQGSEENVTQYSDLIISKTQWKIIYSEPVENPFGYYNTGKELQETGFWQITPTQVILKVSTYISKIFDSEDLINPQAQLEIILNPLVSIKQ